MRSMNLVVLVIVACGLLASACERSETSKPVPAAQPTSESPASSASQPTPQAAAVTMNAGDVQWRMHCDLDDGRRLISDGSLLIEASYFPSVSVPEKSVPSTAPQRLLQSSTDHEFGLGDLQKNAAGRYVAPGPIQLNQKYIDLLRASSLKATLRFRAKGANDPVLILDGQKVVGVVMPIKS